MRQFIGQHNAGQLSLIEIQRVVDGLEHIVAAIFQAAQNGEIGSKEIDGLIESHLRNLYLRTPNYKGKIVESEKENKS